MSTRDKYQLNDLNTSTGLAVSGDAILRDGVCVVWRGGAVGACGRHARYAAAREHLHTPNCLINDQSAVLGGSHISFM
jgi:hypothetical protein